MDNSAHAPLLDNGQSTSGSAGTTAATELIFPADLEGVIGVDGSRRKVSIPQLKERKQEAHKVRAHENIELISELALGSLASRAQLETYKKAIRDLNSIAPDSDVAKGQMLKMPGVSKSGDFTYVGNGISKTWIPFDGSVQTDSRDGTRIVNYRNGKTVMRTADGTEYITNADHTTEIRTSDGTIIHRDARGETVTKDGITRKFDLSGKFKSWSKRLKNGGIFEAGLDDDDTYRERQTGDRSEQNYVLTEASDGNLEVQNEGSNDILRFSADSTAGAARHLLLDLAKGHILEPELLSKFKADMIRFEDRLHKRNLTGKEIADTYRAIARLLDETVPGKMPFHARVVLAQQVLSQAATTSGIDQGYHKTCNITGAETRAYERKPWRVAQLIGDCALDGRFGLVITMTNWGIEMKPSEEIPNNAPTGKYNMSGFRYDLVVNMPQASLRPDCEAASNPPPDGHRSFASQIYQVAAINAVYADNDLDVMYVQTRPSLSSQAKDTGERFFDTTVDPPREIIHQLSLTSKDIARSYELVTGEACKHVVLENAKHWGQSSYPGVGAFASEKELAAKLAQAKREINLPILLTIHSGNEPFYSDSGNDAAGGAGYWHGVLVADFDEKTGGVYIDNQWGSTADHLSKPVPLVQIYMATLPPGSFGPQAENIEA